MRYCEACGKYTDLNSNSSRNKPTAHMRKIFIFGKKNDLTVKKTKICISRSKY